MLSFARGKEKKNPESGSLIKKRCMSVDLAKKKEINYILVLTKGTDTNRCHPYNSNRYLTRYTAQFCKTSWPEDSESFYPRISAQSYNFWLPD